jgi:chromosome segregation ATPase
MNDYLSVKEFSAAAGVSTQTIYKQLETRLAPHVKESGGRKYISKAALEEFYKVQQDATELQSDATKLQPDATSLQSDASEIQPEPTDELSTDQPSLQPTAPTQNGNQRELDLLQELVKTIQKELEEKNKQLEIKDKQIQDLSDRLAEAMQLTRGQQYIAAADKTKDLVDEEAETDTIVVSPAAVPSHTEPDPEEERPKKKGILARIFGW